MVISFLPTRLRKSSLFDRIIGLFYPTRLCDCFWLSVSFVCFVSYFILYTCKNWCPPSKIDRHCVLNYMTYVIKFFFVVVPKCSYVQKCNFKMLDRNRYDFISLFLTLVCITYCWTFVLTWIFNLFSAAISATQYNEQFIQLYTLTMTQLKQVQLWHRKLKSKFLYYCSWALKELRIMSEHKLAKEGFLYRNIFSFRCFRYQRTLKKRTQMEEMMNKNLSKT